MKILGIESTCDESGIALIEFENNKLNVISNLLASQIKIHRKYGGVVPHLAAREHKKNLPYLFKKLKKEVKNLEFDFIAFSQGPGLAPALLEGKKFTQKLAKKYNVKILPVNHLLAHIFISLLKEDKIENPKLPAVSLLISGGHTELFLIEGNLEKNFKIKFLGETLDDAVGESFDKVARMIGFPYPGGPEIEKLAKSFKGKFIYDIKLPRPLLWQKSFNFSFSGLKTAVLYKIKKTKKITKRFKVELAVEFQNAVFEVLLDRVKRAINLFGAKTLIVGGGVSANEMLKEYFYKNIKNIDIFWPKKTLATDNALMIAIASIFYLRKNKKLILPENLDIDPNLKINL
jgi:N6-L-threonylcarbamoyladenine synthase